MPTLIHQLKKNRDDFHAVVSFDHSKEKLAALDLTENNTALTEEIYSDTKKFSAYIDEVRKESGAKFLIGGYNELREMYKRSLLFDFEKKYALDVNEKPPEARRLHLGIDIWGDAGTVISAPLGGMVHSFAFNNTFGDYGATIILQHQLGTLNFYTLYGHLSLADIKGIRSGQFITRGQPFAHFGLPVENGNWPPHLHFQVITDLRNFVGDYPGVCKYSEREKYLANCPDADLVLKLNQYAV
ncbi:MAG: peptidoglycan DD-metalloendopeptidase family protein [Ferruginibacter sp.]